jgi:hypothetical protein
LEDSGDAKWTCQTFLSACMCGPQLIEVNSQPGTDAGKGLPLTEIEV